MEKTNKSSVNKMLVSIKDYFRFTFITSNNWVVFCFAIVITSGAMINEWVTQGELTHSLLFLIFFGLTIAHTIKTFLDSKKWQ
jgi:hypothetical protein